MGRSPFAGWLGAIGRWIEHQACWSIRRFVRTGRRYPTIENEAGPYTINATDPLHSHLSQVLEAINSAR